MRTIMSSIEIKGSGSGLQGVRNCLRKDTINPMPHDRHDAVNFWQKPYIIMCAPFGDVLNSFRERTAGKNLTKMMIIVG